LDYFDNTDYQEISVQDFPARGRSVYSIVAGEKIRAQGKPIAVTGIQQSPVLALRLSLELF
jgi:hypothetical protein